jgi:hypothetical protein
VTCENINVVEINSQTSLDSKHGRMLWNLSVLADQDSDPAVRNFQTTDWQNKPETLLYCLYTEKRFDSPNGCLFAVVSDDEFVSVGGVYRSDFNFEQIAVAGVRTFTNPARRDRFWHGEFLIPSQIEWASNQKMSQVIFSVNLGNEKLIKFLNRATEGRAIVLGRKFPEVYKRLVKQEFLINLKGTVQQIYKLNLVDTFEWDYTKLKATQS